LLEKLTASLGNAAQYFQSKEQAAAKTIRRRKPRSGKAKSVIAPHE